LCPGKLFARVPDRILHLHTGVQLRKNFLVAPEKRAYYIMIQNQIQGPKVGYQDPPASHGGICPYHVEKRPHMAAFPLIF
jgi:hypothetical protein